MFICSNRINLHKSENKSRSKLHVIEEEDLEELLTRCEKDDCASLRPMKVESEHTPSDDLPCCIELILRMLRNFFPW